MEEGRRNKSCVGERLRELRTDVASAGTVPTSRSLWQERCCLGAILFVVIPCQVDGGVIGGFREPEPPLGGASEVDDALLRPHVPVVPR